MSLPVDLERLRREFPELTDDDLAAYAEITRRILDAEMKDRPRLTREALEGGRTAREVTAGGGALTDEQRLFARYLDAVDKMQRSTVRKSPS